MEKKVSPLPPLITNGFRDWFFFEPFPIQAGQWGFIEYRPPNKKPEYRPNIDHTALYRPNIDRKISLKNEYYRN